MFNNTVNVTVPEERSATAIGYKRARVTRNKVKHSQDGDIEGNTALQLVSLLRLPICVTKTPHLSPQHYELNARQHVLDRTRVLVSRRCIKATKPTSLGEVAAQT